MTAKLQYKEIARLTKKEINTKLQQMREELFKLRMQKVTSGVKETHKFGLLRQNIAKLLTAATVCENQPKKEKNKV